MARSMAARYLVAAFAFMAAAAWLSVGLKGGFTCLLVSVLAFRAVHLYQRRNDSRNRRARPRPGRGPIHEPAPAEPSNPSPSGPAGPERPRRSGRIYDSDREDFGWAVASEATW